MSLLVSDMFTCAGSFYRNAGEEDEYGSPAFHHVLFRLFDFSPAEHYDADEARQMGTGPDYDVQDIPVRHLSAAQIAWADMMVSPPSKASCLAGLPTRWTPLIAHQNAPDDAQ